MIKAVIFYNAALTHHLLATFDHDSDLSLQRAKILYGWSLKLLKNRHHSNRRGFPLLHMTLLNNLGHVSYNMVDYSTSKKCFDQLHRNLINNRRTIKGTNLYQNDLIAMHFNTVMDSP